MTQNTWNASFYDTKHNFVTNYGNDVIDLLQPQTHETILDLGCGSGKLTANIAKVAQKTIGIDSSQEMINMAQKHFPAVEFHQHNAELPLPFAEQFDAIFSNAALHWMLNADAVAKNVTNSLKTGGRFVFEMGGHRNIATIVESIEIAAKHFGLSHLPIYNYFPSIAEYATILERHGLEVRYAILFDRPTLLDGKDGLRNWIKMFRNSVLDKISTSHHEEFFTQAEAHAKEKLYLDEAWYADYVRLRMVAIKK